MERSEHKSVAEFDPALILVMKHCQNKCWVIRTATYVHSACARSISCVLINFF